MSAASPRKHVPVSVYFYCKAFAPKIKEIFSAEGNFFAELPGPQHRQGQQPGQPGQRFRPKGPQRAQRLGKGAEKQRAASRDSQQHKTPQLPRAPAQQKEKHAPPRGQTIQGVQPAGDAGKPQPEGPEQIIKKSHRQPQQDGLPENQQLAEGRPVSRPHPIQTDG